MDYEISLTASLNTETEEADNFTNLMISRGFSIIQGNFRKGYGDKVYIAFTISPIEMPHPAVPKGGRPSKLSDEQKTEIICRLSSPDCNKSALAREYSVSYQTINKIHKTIT